MPHILQATVVALTLLAAMIGFWAASGLTRRASSRFGPPRTVPLAALDAGEVGYWELTLPQMSLRLSPQARALLGREAEAAVGLDDLMDLSPADPAARRGRLETAIADRTPYDGEFRVPLRDGGTRWVNLRGRVVETGPGSSRMVGVAFDISERQEAFAAVAESDRRQRLLIDELNHRVKNTLAAVQSISRQSAKRAGSLEDFRDLFESRLIALSQTHNALTRSAWAHAGLTELLAQQLEPYPAEQVTLIGPEVELSPREALALGMVFHELATNAAKYGALSLPTGRVSVSWEVVPDPRSPQLVLEWREGGGPAVAQPARRGFGTRMVQGAIVGELGGSADLTFAPDGFQGRLSLALDQRRAGPPPAPLALAAVMGAG